MQADFVLDYDQLQPGQAKTLHLMARFVTGPAPADRERRPLNLSLVIDRSGSMAGAKLDYTRQAAQMLVQNLSAQDILSVVLYSDTVETLLMPEHVRRKDIISQRIATIKASGTTNLSSGWLEGCNLVGTNQSSDVFNRVILMSDGHANRGVTSQQRLVEIARQKFGEGISTTTMGLGADFNEDLLMAMADAGGGAFYFIESPEVTPSILREELQGLLSVVAQNLIVTIEPTLSGMTINQLNAYPLHADGTGQTFRLGDVFGDEVKAVLLEISLPAQSDFGPQQIAVLRFEYDELLENSVEHHVKEFPITIDVSPPGGVPLLPNPEVSRSVLLLGAAQARRRAIQAADNGKFVDAAQMLRNAADAIAASQANDAQLMDEQKALIQQASEMDDGAGKYAGFNRKMMSTQAYYTMSNRHDDTVMLRVRDANRQKEPDASPDDADGEHLVTHSPDEPNAANMSNVWKRPEIVNKAPDPADAIQIEKRDGVTPTHATWNHNTFALLGELIRIGRSRHNEIVISANGVSRFHCQLRREGDRLMLEDLGSTNGTQIDGELVKEPRALSVGDVVYVCDEKLIFHEGDS